MLQNPPAANVSSAVSSRSFYGFPCKAVHGVVVLGRNELAFSGWPEEAQRNVRVMKHSLAYEYLLESPV
jgi:hypothetical protein